jgi:hypothetical protein
MRWSLTACGMISLIPHVSLYAMELHTLEQSSLSLHVVASLTVSPRGNLPQTLCSINSWYDATQRGAFNLSRATVTHAPDIKREYAPNMLALMANRLLKDESDIPQKTLTDISHQAPESQARYKMLLALLNVDHTKRTATVQCSIYKKFNGSKTIILQPTLIQCILGTPYPLDLKQQPSSSISNKYVFTIKANLEKKPETHE